MSDMPRSWEARRRRLSIPAIGSHSILIMVLVIAWADRWQLPARPAGPMERDFILFLCAWATLSAALIIREIRRSARDD